VASNYRVQEYIKNETNIINSINSNSSNSNNSSNSSNNNNDDSDDTNGLELRNITYQDFQFAL
jgi:hypothetical protein